MILDTFLNENAKAFNGESFVVPAYLAVATGAVTPLITDTVLTGERGTRFAISNIRSSNVISSDGIRSGAQILVPAGETLTTLALFSAATGGTILTEASIGSILQTTAFDIEVFSTLTWNRA
jgi:hypothetical protein